MALFIIDCRPEIVFCRGHLPNSYNIPFDALFERMHELPDRSVALEIVVEPGYEDRAEKFFREKSYDILRVRVFSAESISGFEQSGQWVQGECNAPRPWQASWLVESFLKNNLESISPGKGLDLACGAGRDLVTLALSGWEMSGVDFNADAIRRAADLAKRNAVNVDLYQLDLEAEDFKLEEHFAKLDLVVVSRYLHRPLLPQIANVLDKGGVLIYQTFMKGSELFGSPRNPRFLLDEGELKEVFSGFDVITDEKSQLPDGRPFAHFIARKC